MALLSLCLLPTDYRAGAASAHAHSLLQLWLDAADGGVFHEHAGRSVASVTLESTVSWFDPTFDLEASDQHLASAHSPDLAHQHDSAPAVNGIDLLLAALAFLPLFLVARKSEPVVSLPLSGRFPQVLSPPPRYLLAKI
jgi:hypothetical protein